MTPIEVDLPRRAGRRYRKTTARPALAWCRRLLKTRFGAFGLSLMLLLTVLAVFAHAISPYDPNAIVGTPLLAPGHRFLMGTDGIGRDVFSNVIYGSRVSMIVGAASGLIALVLGCLVGGISGYVGGAVEVVLMRIAELFQVIPSLILAVVIVALLGSHLIFIVLVIGLTLWPQEARILRAQFLTLRERDFVQGAKVLGFGWRHIIFSEILPNAIPPVIVQVTLDAGSAILLEAGLSFLGLGDPSQPSWGKMLFSAQAYLQTSWWLSVFPGIGIVIAVLAFNFVGHGLNEVMNPRAPRVTGRELRKGVSAPLGTRLLALVGIRRAGRGGAPA